MIFEKKEFYCYECQENIKEPIIEVSKTDPNWTHFKCNCGNIIDTIETNKFININDVKKMLKIIDSDY
jgi:hypothetical protein